MGEGVVVGGRWARKWLTQKNTGGESLRLLVGGRKREEGRGGSEKDQGSWPWWNGSSGWSGQRLAGGQRTMSLANWSPRRHFYCGCSTGAGGIWWVGHPREALDTHKGKFCSGIGNGQRGGRRGGSGSPFPGFRGENTLIGQCRKGGFGAGQLVISPSFLYLELPRMCRIFFFPPPAQTIPIDVVLDATPLFHRHLGLQLDGSRPPREVRSEAGPRRRNSGSSPCVMKIFMWP